MNCPVCKARIQYSVETDYDALTAVFSVAHPAPMEPACRWVLEALAAEQQESMERVLKNFRGGLPLPPELG